MTDRNALQRELDALRARRVHLRRRLEVMSDGRTVGGAVETDRLRRQAQLDLNRTQVRWNEIHMLLAKPSATAIGGTAK